MQLARDCIQPVVSQSELGPNNQNDLMQVSKIDTNSLQVSKIDTNRNWHKLMWVSKIKLRNWCKNQYQNEVCKMQNVVELLQVSKIDTNSLQVSKIDTSRNQNKLMWVSKIKLRNRCENQYQNVVCLVILTGPNYKKVRLEKVWSKFTLWHNGLYAIIKRLHTTCCVTKWIWTKLFQDTSKTKGV